MAKKESAKGRAQNKRRRQKNKNRRRLFALGVVAGIVTLVAAAALFPGFSPARSTPVVAKEARKTVSSSPSEAQKASGSFPEKKNPPAMEKRKKESRTVGFGLEDLIQKTRKSSSLSGEARTQKKQKDSRPLLVIIIDDISQPSQLRALRSLPYRITPSIFPPSSMNAGTPRLARGLKHYMIHLPLESSSAKMNRFSKTLFRGDSYGRIDARIRELRRLFPSARFLNNHTGSRFTSDRGAMRRLFKALRRQGWIFVDSRTSGRSVGRETARRFGQPYLYRDVFIDNVQSRSAILAQLKKAVRIAKRRGYAIAIGHPHKATFRALRSAGKVLSQVRTVYMDELYRMRFESRR